MRKPIVCLIALGVIALPMIAPAMAQANQPAAADMSATYRLAEALAAFALTTIAVLLFSWKSDVLRDSDPVDFPGVPSDPKTYPKFVVVRTFSLAQTQMTWWFWIVISSFAFLFLMTPSDMSGGLNAQALTLMGIGAGTAIGAAIIEQSRTDKGEALTAYNDAMKALLDPSTPAANLPALYNALLAARDKLSSDGFFRDILSDADGISLHRFQAVAWTFVLGMIFLYEVFWHGPKMPELTTTELSLLGISAGTYLGLKIPEKPA